MKLFEWEGKKLWQESGIPIPESVLLSRDTVVSAALPPWKKYIVKAQTLSGDRAQRGLVSIANSPTKAQEIALQFFNSTPDGETIEHVLVEEQVVFTKELFVGITYSTHDRSPLLILSSQGGTGVEKARTAKYSYAINPLIGLHAANIREIGYAAQLNANEVQILIPIVLKLWACFQKRDCTLTEINPLVVAEAGWKALDAKVELDDDATFRHKENTFVQRTNLGRLPTSRELAAWSIDRDDHRGVAGSSYVDLEGDLAILASGGGASLACMDALVALGGKPANYTEYSGNPPREKVKKLTEIVLSKPGLSGCWVVGATANFTDILETLTGFVEGIRATKPKPMYPFLIRRAGPHATEAFAMLRAIAKKEGYDFHLYGSDTPMISTAKIMNELAEKYRYGHTH